MQGSILEGYASITTPTLSPKIGSNKFNFKINWNSETGQRLVKSTGTFLEERAANGVLDPLDSQKHLLQYTCIPTLTVVITNGQIRQYTLHTVTVQ